ncbi:MAG: helix-turn-helix domain-containing protein [Deltaproteobacteria bacterium]|nr:helix-turn-helix domain-containing protein [Deltaproteobacteria bacterium]
MNNNAQNSGRRIGSIPRAVDILKCLSNGINTITEIAHQCKTGKTNIHRVLQSLEKEYLVSKDPVTRRYYIGPLIMSLASQRSTPREYLVEFAKNEMSYLSDFTEEIVSLYYLMGIQAICLYAIQKMYNERSPEARMRAHPLMLNPYAGAHRKMLFSQLNDEELSGIIDKNEFSELEYPEMESKEHLIDQIRKIRKQGYAVSAGDIDTGSYCIAAPVFNDVTPVALGIFGSEFRLKLRTDEIVRELKISSERISHRLAKYSDRIT